MKTLAPLLFIGHGSPMNALATNSYTQNLKRLKSLYPMPRAILCISAHWQTLGTRVTHMKQPQTIHDFYGFPQPLFEIQYPAPGSPEVAELIAKTVKSTSVSLEDTEWGLDHGTWAVLCHMFPEANIPVLQLSLNTQMASQDHYQLGAELTALREQGILIIGSGNVVHNLRLLNWQENAQAFPWATEFNAWVKDRLSQRDFLSLVNLARTTKAGELSIPTWEHWIPLLYIIGAAKESDTLTIEHDEIQNASISMLSLSFK